MYLKLLFWLKWTLTLRGFQRSPASAIGVVVAVLVFLPMAAGIAIGCAIGFQVLRPPWNEHLLRGVLLGIYLFWLLAPLLGYALTDSYDVTKLLVYPLSARQIFIGAIAGSLLDFPVLLLLPTLAVVVFAFGRDLLAGLLTLLTVALFLFHTLSLSQAVILASAGILRSRRFRDIAIVILPLFWMGYYVLSQALSRQMVRVRWDLFLRSPAWEALSWLPPGLAARAAAAAARGDFLLSLGFLGLLLLCAAGTVYLAGWLIEKVFAGEEVSPAVRKRAPAPAAPARASKEAGSPTGLRLPPVVEAVVDKEVKYLFRDPHFKLALMNLVYLLFVMGFAFFGGRGARLGEAAGPGMAWGISGWLLFWQLQLLFNVFGTEGGAAPVLFLFPSSRRQILIGKNLTLFTALTLVNLVFALVLAGLSGALSTFGPLFCWMELALGVAVAVGNLVSIWFPYRAVARGWRTQQQSASRGCGYGFLYLGIYLASSVVMLPVLAALLLPTFWLSPAWYVLSIPLAAAYVGGLYLLSLHLAVPLLLRRELDIIRKVAGSEDS